jgi:hypothetical protein
MQVETTRGNSQRLTGRAPSWGSLFHDGANSFFRISKPGETCALSDVGREPDGTPVYVRTLGKSHGRQNENNVILRDVHVW